MLVRMTILKKQLILLLATSLLCLQHYGQMSNGSFESNSSIPNGLGQFFKADGWGNANSNSAAPDYFHYAGNVSCDLPETPMAIVNPFSGSAAMGLIVCGRPGTNLREYLTYDFAIPLVVGQKYLVRFCITNGVKTTVSNSGLGVDRIGVHFADAAMTQTGYDPLNASPQFTINEIFYSKNWESFSFVFEPQVPIEQMIFGLFGGDDDKQIEIREGADPACSYIFIDEVKIIPVPDNYDPMEEHPDRNDHEKTPDPDVNHQANDPWFIPNSFTPSDNNTVNDVFKPIANRVNQWEFSVFNVWGEKLFSTSDILDGWDGQFNGLPCPTGSYIWRVEYPDPTADDPRAKFIKQGTFTLLR
jgi:gliding motility-associated-like protein